MHPVRVNVALALVALVGGASLAVGACSSSSGVASSGGVFTGDAAVEPREASVREGGADAAGSDAGPVIPDTACGAAAAAPVTLYPGSPTTPQFDAIATLGPRRVAQAAGDEGFVLFDTNGGNPSAAPIALGTDLNRIATGGSVLGVVGVTLPDIFFQRYDTGGALVDAGAPLALGSDPSREVAIGQSGGAFLAVWSGAGGVTARGVDTAGQLAGPAFALDTASQQNFTASVVSSGSSFAVLWVGYTFTSPGHTLIRTAFATASTTAKVAAHDISADDRARNIIQLVKTPTGYAALVNEPAGAPDFTAHTRLLILDEAGNLTVNPPPSLAGAVRGLGLAVQGSELGVIVERAAQTVAFRPFDANAKPLAPWVCLGSTAPIVNAAGIDTDGAGYAVIFSTTNRAVALARLDRLGK